MDGEEGKWSSTTLTNLHFLSLFPLTLPYPFNLSRVPYSLSIVGSVENAWPVAGHGITRETILSPQLAIFFLSGRHPFRPPGDQP